jgi:hypothetical protein
VSILLVTDSLEAIRRVLQAYRAGTDPRRVELVVAAVRDATVTADALAAEGFPNVQVVDGGAGALRIAEWRAFAAASAPLVVFAQAHACPRPGYVAAVTRAWAEGGWTVIGPAVENANPASLLSRAAMAINFGHWSHDPARGETTEVPGHNSAYDRAALAALGDELRELLEAGWQLQVALRGRGHRCFLEPTACVAVVNPSQLATFLLFFFRLGRLVAAQRCRRWPFQKRLAYGAGTPLVPGVRLARLVRDAVRRGFDPPWVALPLIVVGLVASAAGELVGYVVGPGAPPVVVRRS